jgi:hypothetical protein
MKEKFINWNPRAETKGILDHLFRIITEEKMSLTVRQIFYKMLGPNFDNTPENYARVSKFLTRARYAGMIDWALFEDRTRLPSIPKEWNNTTELLETAFKAYRLPRTDGQEYYLEIISEKDTLRTFVEPIARKYHLGFSVFRGFSSTTVMYELSRRIKKANGKKIVLLYVGDHDPSGLKMLEDLAKRQKTLSNGARLDIVPVALTLEQVREHNLLPNKTKKGDSNTPAYIAKYGDESWEVDALDPKYLKQALEAAILKYIDIPKMNAIIEREKKDKTVLRELLENAKGGEMK